MARKDVSRKRAQAEPLEPLADQDTTPVQEPLKPMEETPVEQDQGTQGTGLRLWVVLAGLALVLGAFLLSLLAWGEARSSRAAAARADERLLALQDAPAEAPASQAAVDSLAASVQQLERRLDDVDTRLERAGSELVRLGRADRQLSQDVRGLLQSLQRDLSAQEKVLADLRVDFEAGLAVVEPQPLPDARGPEPIPLVLPAEPEAAQSAPPQRLATATPQVSAPSARVRQPDDLVTYTIQEGDNLTTIARTYGVTLDELFQANPGINPRRLQIGQSLLIPQYE